MSKKIVTNLFRYASRAGAHHLVITGEPDRISLDCHFPSGTMRSLTLPKKIEREFFANLQSIFAIAPGELFAHRYQKLSDGERNWKYNLTVLPEGKGEKIIISLVGDLARDWRLGQLGLQPADRKALKNIASLRSGLVIISSPAANGKSSTLSSLESLVDKTAATAYRLESRRDRRSADLMSLPSTRSNWDRILRHDSDVIFADDLDSEWTLTEALRAAASGRLVIGTLTADSALEVINKILKVKLPLRLKLDSLKMVINQRLAVLKRAKNKSKEKVRDRIGLFEILKPSAKLKNLLASAAEKELASAGFQRRLGQLITIESGSLARDEKKKIKDGLI